MLSFGVSVCVLTLAQALVVAAAAAPATGMLTRFRSGWWALVPALSVAGFVLGAQVLSQFVDGLTYLALVAVPVLGAVAVVWAMRGARWWLTPAVAGLFALAWADRGGLAGQGAGVLLDALSCVTLGVLLVAVTPRPLVGLAIVAMALVDLVLVATSVLQGPNDALNHVVPAAHLPQLQREVLGGSAMGYGDLFAAGLLGALLAAQRARQRRAAALVALIGLAMNLLFLVVDELPATVPVALAFVVLSRARPPERRRPRAAPREPGRSR